MNVSNRCQKKTNRDECVDQVVHELYLLAARDLSGLTCQRGLDLAAGAMLPPGRVLIGETGNALQWL